MTAYEVAELTSRIGLASRKALDAAHAQDWQAFDRHLERIGELRADLPISDARTIGTVILKDVTEKPGITKVTIGIEKDNVAMILHPEGTGTWDGPYAPILLERKDGGVRLVVWADINQEEPTHVIDLSDARETARLTPTNTGEKQ